MLQRIAQICLKFDVSEHGTQKPSLLVSARITSSSQDLSIIYLKAVNSHRFNQPDLDNRSWYHGTAASMEWLLFTPSSPDRSRLVPLAQILISGAQGSITDTFIYPYHNIICYIALRMLLDIHQLFTLCI